MLRKDFIKTKIDLIESDLLIAELGTGEEGRLDYKKTFLYLTKFRVYPEKFSEKISQSAGLRNALVHDYDEIRIADVYSSVGEALTQFHEYCEYLLRFVKKHK